MDIAYAGDADFDVSVAGFTGGLNQLQVQYFTVFLEIREDLKSVY